jgi:hypothetical protein
MATELFHVQVIEVATRHVTFSLRIISGEQPDFPSGPSFALMLLYDPIVNDVTPDAPLSRAITLDDTMNVDWLDEHIDRYVVAVDLQDVKNQPITADLERMSLRERREFFQSPRAPSARLAVTVAQPEWVSHLRPGMRWDTAAYDALG